MKITLDMLQKEGLSPYQLLLYSKLGWQFIDLNYKEITIYDWETIDFLKLLAEKFKLTININYVDLNEDDMRFKYKYGLLTYYQAGRHGYFQIYKYVDNLLIESIDSNECRIVYVYNNEKTLLLYQYKLIDNNIHTIITYIYDDNDMLIDIISTNEKYYKLTLYYGITDI